MALPRAEISKGVQEEDTRTSALFLSYPLTFLFQMCYNEHTCPYVRAM